MIRQVMPFVVGLFLCTSLKAQVPNQINYQGIARNNYGTALSNQTIAIRLTIREKNPNGNLIYQESRKVTTNQFGLFSTTIGGDGATNVSGSLDGANWASKGNKFLNVEMDPTGGNSFISLGSSPLTSVPFAFRAETANPVGDAGGDFTGTFPNPTLKTSVVTGDKIANGTITADKLAAGVLSSSVNNNGTPHGPAGGDLEGNYPDPTIRVGVVSTEKVADGAITAAKLAPGVIPTSMPLADNSVTTPKVADGAITAAKIAPGVIPTSLPLADNSVTTIKVADGAITNIKIANNAVNSTNLADNSVTTPKVADGAITAAKIAPGVIPTSLSLADNSVTTIKVADGAITSIKIANNAVSSTNLADNSVTTPKVADGAITAAKIATGVIPTSLPLADNSVTTPKVVDAAITTPKVADGAITAAKIAQGVIPTSLPLADNSVTTIKVADGAITSIKIANNAVSSTNLADNSVTTPKVADGAITAAKIAPGVIPTSLPLADNSVTTPKVVDAAITTPKVADGAITAAKLAAGVIPTGLPPIGAAGGDLAGLYPNPTVSKLSGIGISATAPVSGQILKYNGSNWAPAYESGGSAFTLPYLGSGNAASLFSISNASGNAGSSAIIGRITATTLTGDVSGVIGIVDGGDFGSGVSGTHAKTGVGVSGNSNLGEGVRGYSIGNYGISGVSENSYGVYGSSVNGAAGFFDLNNTANSSPSIFVNNSKNDAVQAVSKQGTGVRAISESAFGSGLYAANLAGGEAISGQNRSDIGGAIAGYNMGNYAGVRGASNSGIGVLAESNLEWSTGGTALLARLEEASGNLAIFRVGTTNMARIDDTGKGYFNGGTVNSGADVAEFFGVDGSVSSYEAGDVLEISTISDRKVVKSSKPYSTLVAGVFATKPGVLLTEEDGVNSNLVSGVPMGVIGVIPTKVCLEGGAIKRGDLLVTSSEPGVAMKADIEKVKVGQVIGKALQDFNGNGIGKINVLVSVK